MCGSDRPSIASVDTSAVASLLIVKRVDVSREMAVNSGTVTFLDTGQAKLMLTCAHVYGDFVRRRKSDATVTLRVAAGNGLEPLDISHIRPVDLGNSYTDLAVLEPDAGLHDYLGQAAKTWTVSDGWPPVPPDVDSALFVVGFPSNQREVMLDRLTIKSVWFEGTAKRVFDISVEVGHSGHREVIPLAEQLADLNVRGMSGGECYQLQGAKKRFVGIVYGCDSPESVEATLQVHLAGLLRPDGTFSPEAWRYLGRSLDE